MGSSHKIEFGLNLTNARWFTFKIGMPQNFSTP